MIDRCKSTVAIKQLHAFRSSRIKNNKLIMRRFVIFIKQEKDFNEDVWGLIKEFMINPIYKNSYRLEEQREVRLYKRRNELHSPTSYYFGKRYGKVIQMKLIRRETTEYNSGHNIIEEIQEIEEPYRPYKIKIIGYDRKERRIRGSKILTTTTPILIEYIERKKRYGCINNHSQFYMVVTLALGVDIVSAGMIINKLWNELDTKHYNIIQRGIRDQNYKGSDEYKNAVDALADRRCD